MENSERSFKVLYSKPTWKKSKIRYFETREDFKSFLSTVQVKGYDISLYSLVGDSYKFVSKYW